MPDRTVFVVEDADDIRLLYRLSLARTGFIVVGEAASVAEALERAPLAVPDVVIIDLILPDGSGVEVVRSLRASLPAAMLVVCTGAGDDELAEVRKAGAHRVLSKLSATDLGSALSALFAATG
jgi:CheY-like chemotaxis protein